MSLVSLYDAASLWMTPSGAEDGKLFSELPTDGSGDFTFSRGSNLAATRVGPTGLIEKGRENLLTQSNRFDLWNIKNVTSGHAGYDGTNNAWLQSGASRLQRNLTLSSSVYTGSIYVKAGFSDYVQLYLVGSSNALARFELIGNGTIVASSGIYPKIEPVSGATGWYRISTNINASITTFRIYPQNDSSGTQTADSSVYVQDAQLELGLATTDYIESGATTGKAGLLEDEPRLDYSGGATCPSLLLEPQRSNLIFNSEYFGGWNTIGSVSIDYNDIVSPEGKTNAHKITAIGGGTQRIYDVVVASAGSVTWSIYVKAGTHSQLRLLMSGPIDIYFDLSDQSVNEINGTGYIEDVGNNWYRIVATGTAAGGTLVPQLRLDYAAVGEYQYWYGSQIEQGSYPTSYIPTYGSSVTRSVDGGNTPTQDELTSYCLLVDLENLNDGGGSARFVDKTIADISTHGGIYLKSGAQIGYYSSNSGYLTNGLNVADGARHKYLLRVTNGFIEEFFDGIKQNDTGVNSTDKFDALRLLPSNQNASIHQLLVFPTALTDSECIKLTTL